MQIETMTNNYFISFDLISFIVVRRKEFKSPFDA